MTLPNHPPQIHWFKCWPESFEALADGVKTFDVRKDDRVARPRVGDLILLRRWDPVTQSYTGHELSRRVTFVQELGLQDEPKNLYYAMSLSEEKAS